MADRWLTTEQVSNRLGIPAATLRYWRSTWNLTQTGPESVRLGPRHVRYRETAVEAWVATQEDLETVRRAS